MKAKAFLNGRLGKDAETKTFENGNSVIQFSVATSVHYMDKSGEKQQKTDWHDAKMYVKTLNDKFVALLKKGTEVTLMGSISYDEYEDQKGASQKRMFIDVATGDLSVADSKE